MQTLLAFVIGGLFAAGFYLLLRRKLARVIVGLALLSNAANLLIFTVGRLTRGRPPLVPADASVPDPPYADPLPQALILTAIVIGFGVLAFTMVLACRVTQSLGVEDLDDLKATDDLATYEDCSAAEARDDREREETGREPEGLREGVPS